MEGKAVNDIVIQNICKNYTVSVKNGNFFRNLVKRKYEIIEAVKRVSLEVTHGEAVGLVGPNGAGKSTILKIMTGILVPTSGTIMVLGRNPLEEREKNCKDIGVLFGQRSQLWWDLPAEDTFVLLKKIYRISDESFEKNMKRYTDVLDVSGYIGRPVRQLSLGQRARLELMACLLHNPKILFLDEPTLGLDVAAKRQIRDLLQVLKGETTIILTSHDMKDIDVVCERLVVIDKGSVIIDNQISEVKRVYGNMERMEIKIKDPNKTIINFLPAAVQANIEEDIIICNYDSNQISSADILQNILRSYSVVDVSIMSADIDDIIERIYQETNQ